MVGKSFAHMTFFRVDRFTLINLVFSEIGVDVLSMTVSLGCAKVPNTPKAPSAWTVARMSTFATAP
jgi:hypothetical protein